LQEIALFLKMSPHEVVIVDFHRFPIGFSGNFQQFALRHRWLANLINEELGDIAAQVSFSLLIKCHRASLIAIIVRDAFEMKHKSVLMWYIVCLPGQSTVERPLAQRQESNCVPRKEA